MYIPDSMVQDEGVDEMKQRRETTSIVVASQKIEHEPRISEVVWCIVILVVRAGEIWGNPVLLRVGPHTL